METTRHIHAQGQSIRRAVVVGGANTDVSGFSDSALVFRDSNPGRVRISAGGVAHNVAENLVRLGVDTHLVTAFGGDENAHALLRECRDAGIGVEGSVTVSELAGSVYLSMMDEHGDMVLALSDMRPLDALTVAALAVRAHLFGAAELVVADTNLPPETLVWLAENTSAPLMVDAVSVAKAGRAAPILPRLHAIKANGLEAGVLLGREIRNREHAEDAARELVSLGARAAFVTAGALGVTWADASGSGRLAAPSVPEVRNATGAGDAFAAGVAYATLEGWPARQAAALGSACAALTLESEDTVSREMSLESAIERIEATAE